MGVKRLTLRQSLPRITVLSRRPVGFGSRTRWRTAGGFEIGAYLRRLSYEEPREPSPTVPGALVRVHATGIPLDNIDLLLKCGIRIDVTRSSRGLCKAEA